MPRYERRDAKVTIRLPESLRDAIERRAEADRRTISDTMVLLLENALASPTMSDNTAPAVSAVPMSDNVRRLSSSELRDAGKWGEEYETVDVDKETEKRLARARVDLLAQQLLADGETHIQSAFESLLRQREHEEKQAAAEAKKSARRRA